MPGLYYFVYSDIRDLSIFITHFSPSYLPKSMTSYFNKGLQNAKSSSTVKKLSEVKYK